MSGVRKATEIAPKVRTVQQEADRSLVASTSQVRPLTAAAYSCSLEQTLRCFCPRFQCLAAQSTQTRLSGLTSYWQVVEP
jgi:hypothetical protein